MPAKDEYWRNPEKFRAATNQYRLDHPEWHRQSNNEWYHKNYATEQGRTRILAHNKKRREKIKADPELSAKRAEYQKTWFDSNPGYADAWTHKNPQSYMYKTIKIRAKKKAIEFTITQEDIVIPDVCPVLGIPLVRVRGRMAQKNPTAPSLDRLDPAKGYIPGNVRVISNRANLLKGNATLEELRALVAYLERELQT